MKPLLAFPLAKAQRTRRRRKEKGKEQVAKIRGLS